MSAEIDTKLTDFPVCPNCFHVHKDCVDWGVGLDWEVDSRLMNCDECEEPFLWSREIRVYHSTRKEYE